MVLQCHTLKIELAPSIDMIPVSIALFRTYIFEIKLYQFLFETTTSIISNFIKFFWTTTNSCFLLIILGLRFSELNFKIYIIFLYFAYIYMLLKILRKYTFSRDWCHGTRAVTRSQHAWPNWSRGRAVLTHRTTVVQHRGSTQSQRCLSTSMRDSPMADQGPTTDTPAELKRSRLHGTIRRRGSKAPVSRLTHEQWRAPCNARNSIACLACVYSLRLD